MPPSHPQIRRHEMKKQTPLIQPQVVTKLPLPDARHPQRPRLASPHHYLKNSWNAWKATTSLRSIGRGSVPERRSTGAESIGGFHLEVWPSTLMANRDVVTKQFFSRLNARRQTLPPNVNAKREPDAGHTRQMWRGGSSDEERNHLAMSRAAIGFFSRKAMCVLDW